MFKRGRLEANIEKPPPGLEDAAAKVEAERARHRARAERFGTAYKEPEIRGGGVLGNILTKEEYLRLAQMKGKDEVTSTGFDPTTKAEADKRAARASRFGVAAFDYEHERLSSAGLSAEAIELRRARRQRAAKFGAVDPIDVAIAKAAALALGTMKDEEEDDEEEEVVAGAGGEGAGSAAMAEEGEGAVVPAAVVGSSADGETATASSSSSSSSSSSAADGPAATEEEMGMETAGASAAAPEPAAPAEPRPGVLHLRAYKYLPASTSDLHAFFSPLRPSFVEWLNGVSVNVVFEDPGTAARALELVSEPIPLVPSVPPPPPGGWRVCLKPLVKGKTDKYAAAGAETTVYLRPATTDDAKDKAKKTAGARTHGAYSRGGLFSKRAVARERRIAEDLLIDGGAGGGGGGDGDGDADFDIDAGTRAGISKAIHVVSHVNKALAAAAGRLTDAWAREPGAARPPSPGAEDPSSTLKVVVVVRRGEKGARGPRAVQRTIVREARETGAGGKRKRGGDEEEEAGEGGAAAASGGADGDDAVVEAGDAGATRDDEARAEEAALRREAAEADAEAAAAAAAGTTAGAGAAAHAAAPSPADGLDAALAATQKALAGAGEEEDFDL
jgi:hypothetical protein